MAERIAAPPLFADQRESIAARPARREAALTLLRYAQIEPTDEMLYRVMTYVDSAAGMAFGALLRDASEAGSPQHREIIAARDLLFSGIEWGANVQASAPAQSASG
jgi:hypothetical protein